MSSLMNFSVSIGKLYCNTCQEEIALKVTVIRLHLKSAKYLSGKAAAKIKAMREILPNNLLPTTNRSTYIVKPYQVLFKYTV